MKTTVMSRTSPPAELSQTRKRWPTIRKTRWLARGPRIRLFAAEMVRDNPRSQHLACSRNQRIGGPPVNPYELS